MRPRHRRAEQARASLAGSPALVAQVAMELGLERASSCEGDMIFRGSCPACGGSLLLWDSRPSRPPNAWLCLHCQRGGRAIGLWMLMKGRAVA